MLRETTQIWIVLIFLLGPALSVSAGEGIIFDSETGNYVITYKHAGLFKQSIFIPPNKIDPIVKSKYKEAKNGEINYQYKVKNSKTSKQYIGSMDVKVSSVIASSFKTPKGWRKNVLPYLNNLSDLTGWGFWEGKQATDGLAPGSSQNGFGFDSTDLPGVGLVRLRGATPVLEFDGYGPSQEISDKLEVIEQSPEVDSVKRPAAIPKIPVPDPFDAATVLTSLQEHVKEDLVRMDQVDLIFASQLDRLFETAIAAVNQGNLVAAKSDIKELKRLLHEEHEGQEQENEDDNDNHKDKTGLITKLAAKVLLFDLKYIEKQLKGKDDD